MTSTASRTGKRIDPRIRDRRLRVTRARGQRRRRVLALLVLVALVAVAAFGVSQSPLLAVRDVVVTGATRVDAEEIRSVSGIDEGAPILFADLRAARERIETMPWIATAHVRRDLPRTVRIEVTERVPVGWIRNTDGAVALVDGTGRLLAVLAEPPALAELIGLDVEVFEAGSTAAPVGLVGLLEKLPDELGRQVAGVVRADEGGDLGAVLVLANGTEVRLGTLEQIPEKASAALAVLAALGDVAATYVDVSVPAAPTTDVPPDR